MRGAGPCVARCPAKLVGVGVGATGGDGAGQPFMGSSKGPAKARRRRTGPGDPVNGQVLPTRTLGVHTSIGSAQATNQNGLFGFTA